MRGRKGSHAAQHSAVHAASHRRRQPSHLLHCSTRLPRHPCPTSPTLISSRTVRTLTKYWKAPVPPSKRGAGCGTSTPSSGLCMPCAGCNCVHARVVGGGRHVPAWCGGVQASGAKLAGGLPSLPACQPALCPRRGIPQNAVGQPDPAHLMRKGTCPRGLPPLLHPPPPLATSRAPGTPSRTRAGVCGG